MKLVDDWKSAWRWFSMHALVLAGVIPTVWAELPPDLKTAGSDGRHYSGNRCMWCGWSAG